MMQKRQQRQKSEGRTKTCDNLMMDFEKLRNVAKRTPQHVSSKLEGLQLKGLGSCWKDVTKNYLVMEKIGEGSFGKVYKAKCKKTGRLVAIKHLDDFSDSEYEITKIVRELKIMRQVSHQTTFMPALIDVVIPEREKKSQVENIFLIMEFENTDLKKTLNDGILNEISQEHIKLIFYNLLCAVKFMHSANIVHRDLKPANILINKDCQVKICDFGLARTLPESLTGKGSGNTRRVREAVSNTDLKDSENIKKKIAKRLVKQNQELKSKKRSLSSHVCSRWYRAPEICVVENQYDQASDMWSIGCILYEMLYSSQETHEQAQKQNDDYRRVLFQGLYSCPLSPNPISSKRNFAGDQDQVFQTLRQMDVLTELDLSGFKCDYNQMYLKKLQEKAHKGLSEPGSLKNLYRNEKILKGFKEILQNILTVNPYFRWTAAECLDHQMFDNIRHQASEMKFRNKIKIELDQDDAFDYEEGKSLKFTKKDVIQCLKAESDAIHLEWVKKNN